MSVLSAIYKHNSTLIVSNVKEFLIKNYSGHEEDSLYNYIHSKAYNKLIKSSLNKDAFPAIPINEIDITWVNINKVQAGLMLNAFKFISDYETRYFMNGIYFDSGNAVSTDGKRMFYSSGFDNFPAIILPVSKCISFILQKGTNIKYGISVKYSVFQFAYKNEAFTYYLFNIEGQFPNWAKIIPEKQTYSIGIPDIEKWKSIYNIINQIKVKKGISRIIIKPETESKVVNVYLDHEIGKELIFIGSILWNGFYDEGRIKKDKELYDELNKDNPVKKEYESKELIELAINPIYLNDALTLKPLKEIQFTSFRKVITFVYTDGSFNLTMPMELI